MNHRILFAALVLPLLLSPLHARAAESNVLQIGTSSWGYGADRKDVKQDVVNLCEGKSSCSLKVGKDRFKGEPKDPSPGNSKALIVSWKCGGKNFMDQVPDGKIAELKCD